jgi:hypothetical protein
MAVAVDTYLTLCNCTFKMKLTNGIYGNVLPDKLMGWYWLSDFMW